MPYTKNIICLANSRKPPSGRCIAGREFVQDRFREWIRPISARSTREISEEERRYEDGSEPRLLDVIAIQMAEHVPERHQQENHVIDDKYDWVKQGTIEWRNLLGAVEEHEGPLWLNKSSSTYGFNDRVQDEDLEGLNRSLYLVRPTDLRLVVAREGDEYGSGRRKVRARFKLAGLDYTVVVTDPLIEGDYFARDNGEYPLNDALICMSLGEVFHGFAYKLAAAVITPKRAKE